MANTTTQTKDLGLLIPLSLLNIVSFWTTTQGAALALNHEGIGIAAGVSIQGILFILLAGMAAGHAPVRKWIAIAAFSFLSIYTSFFTYHNSLISNDNMIGAQFRPAEIQHEQLVSQAVGPLQEEFNELQARDKALQQELTYEENGQGRTGIPGRGPEARRIIAERNELAPEIEELRLTVAQIQQLLSQAKAINPGSEDAPEQLFKIDKAIWEVIPVSERPDASLAPRREDYFDQASRFDLLTPLFMLLDGTGDRASIAAFALAGVIDGISIMLGTAIDKRARQAPFENISDFVTQCIWGFKSAVASIKHYWHKKGHRHPKATVAEAMRANEVVILVKLILEGQGSDFLMNMVDALDFESKAIALDLLLRHENPTFQRGYKLLLEAFRQPALGWIEIAEDSNTWMFVDDICYTAFLKWLNEEIIYQLEYERQEGLQNQAEEDGSPKVVPFRHPSAA